MTHPAVFRPLQSRFLTIPQAPVCYWLRERFFELLAGRTLGDVADVCQGLATADDARFVRFVWEVPPPQWRHPVRARRWVPFEKGGGYGKWFGHHFWAVDWEQNGARIKATPGPRVQNEQHYFKEGWTYSYMARGSLGLRHTDTGTIFSHLASTIFFRRLSGQGASLLNCRFSSSVVRSLSAKIQLNESYVARVPLPERIPDSLRPLESACIQLKRYIVAHDLTERTFDGLPTPGVSLTEAWRNLANEAEAVAAVLHTLEGLSEREVFAAYDIAGDDVQAVLDETGTPAGWFPLIAGYEQIPALPPGLDVPAELLAPLANEPHRTLPASDLDALKRRLRALYEAGPGAKTEDDEGAVDAEDEEDENGADIAGARIPIPAETFLEELSQKLEIHPISLYWLLRDLREKDGVVCQPELQRFVENYVTVTVLRLLGHRWPKQILAGEPLPSWADKDGVIPLTGGTGEPTLLERVRERIAEDFGPDRVNAIEQEFEQLVGKPLGTWLATEFFPRHISQFKKRPIAWQIGSSRKNGKRGRRGKTNAHPAFSCLVYYHRLDADLLPKLRSQYVGPLRTRLQTELAGLERLDTRTADQDERRVQLEMLIEELKDFDARLEQVITMGFSSPALDAIARKEPLDRWTSRDGASLHPQTREAFLAQEQRYDPDLNDGARVNIAPLQRAGLLAAEVLAAKDVEKAIADRAEWRADERRWCREGKLPQPGWWAGAQDEFWPDL